jgi:hypothetical protein
MMRHETRNKSKENKNIIIKIQFENFQEEDSDWMTSKKNQLEMGQKNKKLQASKNANYEKT